MDEELRTALTRYLTDQASLIGVEPTSDQLNPIIAGTAEQATKRLNRLLFAPEERARMALEAGCTSFSCPGSFGCDWF